MASENFVPQCRTIASLIATSAKAVHRTVALYRSSLESVSYDFKKNSTETTRVSVLILKGIIIVDTMQQFLLSVAFHNKTE